MKCMILAGGFATRLYPLTKDLPKTMLEYNGKPVINHIIDKVPKDIELLVSTNKKFEPNFRKWQKGLEREVKILVEEALSEESKLGAIGAIDYWIIKRKIREDLLVIAADNYFELKLENLISRFNGINTLIAVHDVGDKNKACEISKVCQVGLVTLNGNKIVRLDEKPAEPTSSVIATGIYVLPSRVFPMLSEYCRNKNRDNLGNFFSHLIEHEEVQAFPFTEKWIDIGEEINKGRLQVK